MVAESLQEEHFMEGSSPRIVTSRKRIIYKKSTWNVHEFEIWSGELICRALALRVAGSLLLWLGAAGEAQLGAVALALPGQSAGCALATPLLGAAEGGAATARRLALALRRPVYVCSNLTFDRFSVPIIEAGLIAEVKNRPKHFGLE